MFRLQIFRNGNAIKLANFYNRPYNTVRWTITWYRAGKLVYHECGYSWKGRNKRFLTLCALAAGERIIKK